MVHDPRTGKSSSPGGNSWWQTMWLLWLCGSDVSVFQSTWWIIATHNSGVFYPHDFVPSASLYASLPSAVFLSYAQIPGEENLVGWGESGTSHSLVRSSVAHDMGSADTLSSPGPSLEARGQFRKLLETGQTIRDIHFDKDGRQI